MKTTVARMHKHPGEVGRLLRVLKAPDVPSVLVELGYVSNKAATSSNLVSRQLWRVQGRGLDGAGVERRSFAQCGWK